MSELSFIDYKKYPTLYAKKVGVTQDAIELYLDSEVIDPHTVSYVWSRAINYDMSKKHTPSSFLPFMLQVDFPRTIEASMSGMVWDITTNPIHKDKNKLEIVRRNIDQIKNDLEKYSNYFQYVRTYSDYVNARKNNKIASWISIQGGQGVDNHISSLDKIPEVHRITLIHFTKSKIGASNFDKFSESIGLSDFGKEFVQKMVENKMLVDLSHINKKGFMDALDIMPKDIPPVVTHTGVKGIFDCWRNIDDEQIKAISNRGGTIGIIYYPKFLRKDKFFATTDDIVKHMEHVINIAGEDAITLGSDYDGAISLPKDFKDITYQPVLVQKMLNRKWSEKRIKKILGLNFLRVVKEVSP